MRNKKGNFTGYFDHDTAANSNVILALTNYLIVSV